MPGLHWSETKNQDIQQRHGITFEEVAASIEAGHLLDVLAHPNRELYPQQLILVVEVDEYVYAVPAEERSGDWHLVTAYPSRKLTRHYLEEPR